MNFIFNLYLSSSFIIEKLSKSNKFISFKTSFILLSVKAIICILILSKLILPLYFNELSKNIDTCIDSSITWNLKIYFFPSFSIFIVFNIGCEIFLIIIICVQKSLNKILNK